MAALGNQMVYFLRHERRGPDPTFGSRLTPEGAAAAERLDLPVDRILCSPFVRAMQTVAPLARRRGVRICVEPGLAEGRHAPEFADDARAEWTAEERAQFADVVDTEYVPAVASVAGYPESDRQLRERVSRVAAEGEGTLVCSHQCVLRLMCPPHRFDAMGEWVEKAKND